MDQSRVAKVVEPVGFEDLRTSFEPRHVVSLRQRLRHKAAKCSQHCPASVDQLCLTVASQGFWIGTKASSVPAVVARKGAIKVSRWLRCQWAQPEWAVWAVLQQQRRESIAMLISVEAIAIPQSGRRKVSGSHIPTWMSYQRSWKTWSGASPSPAFYHTWLMIQIHGKPKKRSEAVAEKKER